MKALFSTRLKPAEKAACFLRFLENQPSSEIEVGRNSAKCIVKG
jgi:hypothetical protein